VGESVDERGRQARLLGGGLQGRLEEAAGEAVVDLAPLVQPSTEGASVSMNCRTAGSWNK
jgi:hypothetical protein